MNPIITHAYHLRKFYKAQNAGFCSPKRQQNANFLLEFRLRAYKIYYTTHVMQAI